MNVLFVASGYAISGTKTIENSTILVMSAYYLQQLFPDIVKYNIYNLKKSSVNFIMDKIKNKQQNNTQEEDDAILDKININDAVRTMSSKSKQKLLPDLLDIKDIYTEVVLNDFVSSPPQSDTEDEVTNDNDVEYPVQSFTKFDYKMKPFKSPTTYTKRKLETQDPNPHMLYDETYDYEEFNKSGKEADEIPVQKIRIKKIPKYVPPQSYVDQKDMYDGYEQFGAYGNKGMVFKNVNEYVSDLKSVRSLMQLLPDSTGFLTVLKQQIKQPTEELILTYLHETILPYDKSLFDYKHIDEPLDQSQSDDYDRLDNLTEKIDEVCDVLAKTQYSLDKDAYKRFLNDVLTYSNTSSTKLEKLNIIKNYYIKYKHISAQKIKELIDEYGIDDATTLMVQGNDYMHDKQEKSNDAEEKARVKKENQDWEKQNKKLLEDQRREQKRNDAEEERQIKKYQDELDREEKRNQHK